MKSDLTLLASDAEALLRLTAHDANAKVREARARLKATLAEANAGRIDLQNRILGRTRQAVHRADTTVRAHAYRAAGLALGLGVVGGWLLQRRRA